VHRKSSSRNPTQFSSVDLVYRPDASIGTLADIWLTSIKAQLWSKVVKSKVHDK